MISIGGSAEVGTAPAAADHCRCRERGAVCKVEQGRCHPIAAQIHCSLHQAILLDRPAQPGSGRRCVSFGRFGNGNDRWMFSNMFATFCEVDRDRRAADMRQVGCKSSWVGHTILYSVHKGAV